MVSKKTITKVALIKSVNVTVTEAENGILAHISVYREPFSEDYYDHSLVYSGQVLYNRHSRIFEKTSDIKDFIIDKGYIVGSPVTIKIKPISVED